MIQATVAVYPLQQMGYEAVHQAIAALENSGVEVTAGTMHTMIAGPDEAVFQALQAAYEAAAASGPPVKTPSRPCRRRMMSWNSVSKNARLS